MPRPRKNHSRATPKVSYDHCVKHTQKNIKFLIEIRDGVEFEINQRLNAAKQLQAIVDSATAHALSEEELRLAALRDNEVTLMVVKNSHEVEQLDAMSAKELAEKIAKMQELLEFKESEEGELEEGDSLYG